MGETKQPPETTKQKEPLLPFLLILVLIALVVFLFLYEDQLPLVSADSRGIIIITSSVLVIAVLFRGLSSLTERRPSPYTICLLVALFGLCFVLLQYIFVEAYQHSGLHSPEGVNESITHDKWDALYFSIITWTTTGYGDLVPVGASRWFACSEALLGTFYNGLALVTVVYQLNLVAKARPTFPVVDSTLRDKDSTGHP